MATATSKKAVAAKKAAKKPAAKKSPAGKSKASAVAVKPGSGKVSSGSISAKAGKMNKANPSVVKKVKPSKVSIKSSARKQKGPSTKAGAVKVKSVKAAKPSSASRKVVEVKAHPSKASVKAKKQDGKALSAIKLTKQPANPAKALKAAKPASTGQKRSLTSVATSLKPATSPKAAVKVAVKSGKSPVSAKEKGAKNTGEPVDPLLIKAEKAIREMEETMDLSKMRPRLQAGSAPPLRSFHARNQQQLPKLPEPVNTNKVKFQLEFEFRSSPKILFTSLSDSSGLAGWFADEVQTKDDIFTFVWEGGESKARLVALRDLQLVRFQWLDDTDGTYFQFEIKEDDITSDIALVITDFANPGEKDTNIRLWESQVQKLRMLLGSL